MVWNPATVDLAEGNEKYSLGLAAWFMCLQTSVHVRHASPKKLTGLLLHDCLVATPQRHTKTQEIRNPTDFHENRSM